MQSLELSGIAMDNDGNPVILKLSRTVPDQEKRELYHVGKTNLPTPPPSRLPTDGTVALRLEITETLSRNTRNTVYGVRVLNADTELELYVPPLVIKVAAWFQGKNLCEEAGMYRVLESLQGIVIPRCFGYFRLAVDHTQMAILPWDGTACVYPRGPHTFDLHRPPHPAAPLKIMLLERLGEHVPTGSGILNETLRWVQ